MSDKNYETVVPNFKPRYAYLETGEQYPIKGPRMTFMQCMARVFYFLFCMPLSFLTRQIRMPIFILVTVTSGALILSNRYLFAATLDQDISDKAHSTASIQSYGLFTNLSESKWSKIQEDTRSSRMGLMQEDKKKLRVMKRKRTWHTDFICPKEQAVGVTRFLGRGGVTICNASGIAKASSARSARGQNGCLVYSFYHKPIDLQFEKAFLDVVGHCEIHVFNSQGLVHGDIPPEKYIYLHPWKLEKNSDDKLQMGESNGKSLQDTIQYLGHEGRTVDLFVLDCAACELNTVDDWFDNNGSNEREKVQINQIIVKVHSARHDVMEHFFKTIFNQNYVTFYKGKLEHRSMRWYGFLKLAPEFFTK